MREANSLAVELHDSCLEGGLQALSRRDVRRRLGDCDRRLCVGGGSKQEVAALGRKRQETSVNEVPQRLRHWKRLPRLDVRPRPLERPDDLERVEGITARRPVDLSEQRAWKHSAEVVVHDAAQRGEAERSYRDGRQPRRGQRTAQLGNENGLRGIRRASITPTCSARSLLAS